MISRSTYPDLANKNVLITGGGTGIGADLVRAFAEQGCQVAFLDVATDASQLLVDELANGHHKPVFCHCDLTDIEQLKSVITQLHRQMGQFHILVNNAANDQRYEMEEVDEKIWDWTQAVNIKHQFFAIQAVMEGMKALGTGSIINFTSIAWMAGAPSMSPYVTAKAAVVGLTNSMARDLGQYNIRVNAIAPGAVLTEKQRRLWFDQAKIDTLVARQCLQRELDPLPIARTALFLASDASDMITKQTIIVDGGLR